MLLNEADYREKIQKIYDAIEESLKTIDPDIAECEQSLGAMTISFADRSRCILSAQPSVKQIWLALASLGTAYHFSFNESKSSWFDDKGRDIELLSYLEKFLSEEVGKAIKIQRP